MGDRVLIVFHNDKKDFSPVTYMHWGGSTVEDRLRECYQKMEYRREDLQYSAARFVGLCHEGSPGNLSLGIWNSPEGDPNAVWAELTSKDFSHGDAGVILVDASTWKAKAFNGYGFGGRKSLDLNKQPATT